MFVKRHIVKHGLYLETIWLLVATQMTLEYVLVRESFPKFVEVALPPFLQSQKCIVLVYRWLCGSLNLRAA